VIVGFVDIREIDDHHFIITSFTFRHKSK